MFLRCTTRKKNGKEHRYWNLVENRRVAGGQVVQRQVLYLGEINDSQQEVWRKSIEVFEDGRSAPRTVALFAEDQRAPVDDGLTGVMEPKTALRCSVLWTALSPCV